MAVSKMESKALRLEALVETRIVRQHGLIPMFVRASDYELPTAEDYRGAYRHRHLKGKTEEELDEDTFRFVRPGEKPAWAGADDTIEQWAIESRLIDSDSLTAWLAAYWEGRWRGYW